MWFLIIIIVYSIPTIDMHFFQLLKSNSFASKLFSQVWDGYLIILLLLLLVIFVLIFTVFYLIDERIYIGEYFVLIYLALFV